MNVDDYLQTVSMSATKASKAGSGSELAAVLRNPHHLRIIGLLRREGRLSFTAIQKALDLNPAQVDRALKLLTSGLWIIPETPRSAGKGPIRVQYRLGERGRALARALDAFVAKVEKQRRALGETTVREAEALLA